MGNLRRHDLRNAAHRLLQQVISADNHYCIRCGRLPLQCVHGWSLAMVADRAHADRIAARYAFGKLHDPDHDTADYTDLGVDLRSKMSDRGADAKD
jgi:hypothetical protein